MTDFYGFRSYWDQITLLSKKVFKSKFFINRNEIPRKFKPFTPPTDIAKNKLGLEYAFSPTDVYSCRWFLLDFKREFTYADTFYVWETIWSSRKVVSTHFYLFVALALVESYRDIILDRQMDFTDIIKFFNEMAEKHEAAQILDMARDLLSRLQTMIVDKWSCLDLCIRLT